jgi:hypothetical protein
MVIGSLSSGGIKAIFVSCVDAIEGGADGNLVANSHEKVQASAFVERSAGSPGNA